MKLNCGPTHMERRQQEWQRFCTWHKWFAWYPVRVGSGDCRWLEYVERKASGVSADGLIFEFTPYDFEHRAMEEAA